jgi:phosphate transport system substrate-binding protein
MFSASSAKPSRKAVRGAAVAAGLLTAFTTTAMTIVPASAATSQHQVTVSETPPKGSVNVFETGSTLLYPLFQLWSSAYHKQYPNIKIIPSGTGSGTGISDAEDGIVDIGASDAYLSGSEVSQHPGIMNIALAISAQQVNYNVPGLNHVHLKLDGTVLAEIYEGKITEWNDPAIAALNPTLNLPADKIIALHRSDSSGDTFLFSSYLSDANPNGWGANIGYGTSIGFPSISNALGEDGNGGMVTGCAATPGCIAYIGISYLGKTQAAGLGEAMLENKSGKFLLPTPTTITAEAKQVEAKTPPNETLSMIYDSAAGGYPIINYEYAIIPPKELNNEHAQAVKAFLAWAVDPKHGSASSFLDQVDFQPLPPSVANLSLAQIAKVTG